MPPIWKRSTGVIVPLYIENKKDCGIKIIMLPIKRRDLITSRNIMFYIKSNTEFITRNGELLFKNK